MISSIGIAPFKKPYNIFSTINNITLTIAIESDIIYIIKSIKNQ